MTTQLTPAQQSMLDELHNTTLTTHAALRNNNSMTTFNAYYRALRRLNAFREALGVDETIEAPMHCVACGQ